MAAGSLVAAAVAAVGSDYSFESTVRLGGSVLTSVAGAISGEVARYTISTGGETLEYVVAPDGRWVRSPGGTWLALSDPAPASPPLAALATPAAAWVVEAGGDDAVVRATYEGEALGFAGEEVEVTLTIRSGLLAVIEYTVAVGTGQAAVVTRIEPGAPTEPIEVPPG